MKRKIKAAQSKISDVTHRVNETVTGIKIIKIFNHERRSERIFERENHSFYREIMKVVRLKEFTRVFIYGITGISLALILWYGGKLVVNGTITAGGFFSFLTAVFMIFSGGLVLGAVFMATDMVCSPMTNIGIIFYGVLIGILVVVIRILGGLPEGVMYAILFGNACTPLIDNISQPRVYGTRKKVI